MRSLTVLLLANLVMPVLLSAQEHEHVPGMTHPASSGDTAVHVTSAGQAAFGAISEIVRVLEADPATDWTRVNLEGLRQHLIDMNEVTVRSNVRQENVPGGARFTVEGDGRTRDAIRRMSRAHAGMLTGSGEARVSVEETPSGVRLTILATDAGDQHAVARLRGLGFIGMLTVGDHHGPHHLALARGSTPAGH
jgi:hypothetical protein